MGRPRCAALRHTHTHNTATTPQQHLLLTTSVAGRAGWKQLARPLFAEHLTSIHGRDVLCHKTVVSGFFIIGSTEAHSSSRRRRHSSAQLSAHVSVQTGPRKVGQDTTPMWAWYDGKQRRKGGGRSKEHSRRASRRGSSNKSNSKRGAQSVQVCVWVSSWGI